MILQDNFNLINIALKLNGLRIGCLDYLLHIELVPYVTMSDAFPVLTKKSVFNPYLGIGLVK